MAELERRDDALQHRNPGGAQKNPGWRELSSLYEIPGDVFVFDLYLHRVNYGMSPLFPSRADANAWWTAKRGQMPGVRAVLRVGKRARRNPWKPADPAADAVWRRYTELLRDGHDAEAAAFLEARTVPTRSQRKQMRQEDACVCRHEARRRNPQEA